jgi:hypothetical protein
MYWSRLDGLTLDRMNLRGEYYESVMQCKTAVKLNCDLKRLQSLQHIERCLGHSHNGSTSQSTSVDHDHVRLFWDMKNTVKELFSPAI